MEAPGHGDAAYGGGQFGGRFLAAGDLLHRVDLGRFAEDGAQGGAQFALGDFAVVLLGLAGGVRGLVQDDRGGRVQDA